MSVLKPGFHMIATIAVIAEKKHWTLKTFAKNKPLTCINPRRWVEPSRLFTVWSSPLFRSIINYESDRWHDKNDIVEGGHITWMWEFASQKVQRSQRSELPLSSDRSDNDNDSDNDRWDRKSSISAIVVAAIAGEWFPYQGHPTTIFGKYLFGRRFDI